VFRVVQLLSGKYRQAFDIAGLLTKGGVTMKKSLKKPVKKMLKSTKDVQIYTAEALHQIY
jgi:hypothetical protein